MSGQSLRWVLLSGLYCLSQGTLGQERQAQSSATSVLSSDVQRIYQSAPAVSVAPPTLSPDLKARSRFDARGHLQVKVDISCGGGPSAAQLTAAGFTQTSEVQVAPMCALEGYIAPARLKALSTLPGIVKIELPTYRARRRPVGSVSQSFTPLPGPLTQALGGPGIDGAAVSLLRTDQFATTTSVNGAGVTVGVLSDDVTSLNTIVAAGELPGGITRYPSSNNPTPTDEGTMMLEEVHALAPGAQLAFCGPQSEVEFIACVQNMIAGGVSVLVDDIAYVDDAMSNQGAFAQALQSLLVQHPQLLFFSAVGNYQGSYWEGSYSPVALSSPLTCGANGQVDAYVQPFGATLNDTLTVLAPLTAPIAVEWADPWNGNLSNFDLYILDHNFNILDCIPGAGSALTVDIVSNPNLLVGTYHLAIATPTAQLSGKLLKLMVLGDGASALSVSTSGAILSPHKFVPGVITVGAVDGADGIGATIEPYSSMGPVQLAFPLASLQAPQLVAPDHIYVDVTGTLFASQAPSGLFRGTSAAAPNAAAVAALLRAAFPSLTASQVTSALQQGAQPLGISVPNATFGYGRVDALAALGALPAPALITANAVVISAGSGASFNTPAKVTGTGTLKFQVTSDNAAMLPPSGVAFDPNACMASNTCALTLNPLPLQTGVAHLSFQLSDGAHRASNSSLTVAVNKPAPPTLLVTGEPSQEVAFGSAVTPATVVPNGAGTLTLTASTSNAALLPAANVTVNGAGCGGAGSSCLVNMTPVAGASGSATVTVTVADAYGQSAVASVSLTVDAAPGSSKGGGGAIDLSGIVGLLGAWGVRIRMRRGVARLSGFFR